MEKIALPSVEVSVSIVSHGQISLVTGLLHDIEAYCKGTRLEVILTLNLPEQSQLMDSFPWPCRIIRNTQPKGFGENHNQAFELATGDFFCVLNPDVRFTENPFRELVKCLNKPLVGVAAPLVVNSDAGIEDSFRRFPTPMRVLGRLKREVRMLDYSVGSEVIYPEWVAGMFMLFPRQIFSKLSGFDEQYFLYYEDVDICARLSLLDLKVALSPQATVVHHAQRDSHRSFRYFRWHLRSMSRFFLSPVYRQLRGRARQ